LLRALNCTSPTGCQILVTGIVLLGKGQRRFVDRDRAGCLCYHRLLAIDGCVEVVNLGLCGGHIGPRPRNRHDIISVVDLGEHLPSLDRLVVAHEHFAQVAADLWCDDRGVGPHIGVVRGYFEASCGPIMPAVIRGSGNGHDRRTREEQPPSRNTPRTCRARRSFTRFLRWGLELDRLCGTHLFTSNNESA